MPGSSVFEFSTTAYSESEKFDAWRDQNKVGEVVVGQLGARSDSALDCHFLGVHLDQIMVGSLAYSTKFEADPISYDAIRCMKRIREDGFDHYYFRTSSNTRWQASKFGHTEQVLPHQLCVADLAQPYQVDIRAGNFVMLIVPRKLIPFDLSARHIMVVNSTLATMTSQYLHSMATRIREISASEIPSIAQATLGMLVATLMPTQDHLRQVEAELKTEVLHRIKMCINKHLESPTLNVDSVCKAAGLSRASLYRLFSESNTGVNEYIKVARLRKIYATLSTPTLAKQRLSELAYQYGFYNVSSLTRDFKKYFGCTPRDVQCAVWNTKNPTMQSSQHLARDFKAWHYG